MRICSTAALLVLLRGVHARTWRDIVAYHELSPRDGIAIAPLAFEPLEFSESPTVTQTNPPTGSPAASPLTLPSTATTGTTGATMEGQATISPTLDPYRSNDIPQSPPDSYFNYDMRSNSPYGPGQAEFVHTDEGFVIQYQNNGWARANLPDDSYWAEFDTPGYGPWAGVLAGRNPEVNQCDNYGNQSPIDVRMSGVACVESHQIRTRAGDFRVEGANVERRIESNKLRLVYERRPCADLLDTVCSEPDPPTADFPNGWGGYADTLNIDFKVPAEHRINGEVFDAEMQIYHLHASRRRVVAVSSLIRVDPDGYNYYLQTAIDTFQDQYDLHQAQCAEKKRRGRKLVSEFHAQILGGARESSSWMAGSEKVNDEKDYYETWGEYSTLLEDPNFLAEGEERVRRIQASVWDPYHPMLIPTYWFYGYDGSLTEPPCTEFVSWFVMDAPMVISPGQLEQLKTILFNHVDPDCQRTSVHYDQSVARPIQETAGRQVWRCTPDDFPPDSERQN